MSEDSGEKSEQPTGHKLSQAREKGQVPKSMEVSASVVLLVACGALFLLGPYGWGRIAEFFRRVVWRNVDFSGDPMRLWEILNLALEESLIIILPLALIILVASLLINLYQLGGFMMVWDTIAPKIDKIDFIKGFGRFFKIRTLVECLKSIFKMTVIFLVGYLVIKARLGDFVLMSDMKPPAMAVLALSIALEIFLKTVLLLLILAAMDYGYQRWQFNEDMKMTKQEVKDEYKQIEGDPVVKNRIRQAQRDASRKRQLADVPKSDAVVANPEHFAVALRYDKNEAPAPVVTAKGVDFLALRIKDIAKEHKIPIIENKPLAQALYKAVEVGETIPTEFYKAVAEVLSYVYRVKGRKRRG
jgi:flagellar biosynthetic protein FlhB